LTVVAYASDESETPFTTSVWATKTSASGTLTAGDYIIWASAEYTGDSVSKISAIRVLLDGTEVASEAITPAVSNRYITFSSMGLKTLAAGSHSLVMEVRSETIPQTTKCRRARMLVMKF
jgi:hypothetical protein